MSDCNCLHCKLSIVIIDHYRTEQKLTKDQYPDLGNEEVPVILSNIAQVVANIMTPCEQGEPQLLRRVGLFSAKVIKYALEDLKGEHSPRPGARLQ